MAWWVCAHESLSITTTVSFSFVLDQRTLFFFLTVAQSDPMDSKNGCDFFGSQETAGMYSKCYNDMVIKEAANATVSTTTPTAPAMVHADLPSKKKGRCGQEELGLTAVEWRCSNVYCAKHRYSDIHNCMFDYKLLHATPSPRPILAWRARLHKLWELFSWNASSYFAFLFMCRIFYGYHNIRRSCEKLVDWLV